MDTQLHTVAALRGPSRMCGSLVTNLLQVHAVYAVRGVVVARSDCEVRGTAERCNSLRQSHEGLHDSSAGSLWPFPRPDGILPSIRVSHCSKGSVVRSLGVVRYNSPALMAHPVCLTQARQTPHVAEIERSIRYEMPRRHCRRDVHMPW